MGRGARIAHRFEGYVTFDKLHAAMRETLIEQI